MATRTAASDPSDSNHHTQDQRHESDRRGEHRYPDAHQRPAERVARQARDDLKSKLTQRKSGRP